MREMLFPKEYRVWCHTYKEWERHNVVLTPNGVLLHPDNTGHYFTLAKENHTPSFYTGRTDFFGNKLYEGDIVRNRFVVFPEGDIGSGQNIWFYGVIKFSHNRFQAQDILVDSGFFPIDYDMQKLGSIFENPDFITYIKERYQE